MSLSIKKYIEKTINQKAKIGYDRSVKQWFGILHHVSGSIYSQHSKKSQVKKELIEVLEEFIALYLEKQKDKRSFSEIKNSKVQGAYR
ncbi:MAG: hypothetical protein AAB566_00015 [Patescibacteria group bacterium]